MFIRPWNKESENILKQISLYGKAYTSNNNKKLALDFGHNCKDIIKNDLLDISSIRNKKINRTWFITMPDVDVFPKKGKHGTFYHFKRRNPL